MPRRPRRDRGSGAVWQRKDGGLWVGQISDGYDFATDKRKRTTVYASSRLGVLAKLDAIRGADLPSDGSLRVAAWVSFWLDNIAAPELKPVTYAGYRQKLVDHVLPVIGNRRLTALEPEHIVAIHKRMRDAGRSASTIGQVQRILHACLEDARKWRKVRENVTDLVAAPGKKQGKTKSTRGSLSAEQVRQVLEAASADETWTARWWFALFSGARQGECLGLRWENVHLDATVPYAEICWSLSRVRSTHGCGIPKTCGKSYARACTHPTLVLADDLDAIHLRGALYLLRPKSDASRRLVPLSPALAHHLRVHRTRTAGQENPHGLVWHVNGQPVDPKIDWTRWSALLKAAGLPHRTLHEARHTTATLLMEQKTPLSVISEILGHSDAVTTQLYQHASLELTGAAVTQLGDMFGAG